MNIKYWNNKDQKPFGAKIKTQKLSVIKKTLNLPSLLCLYYEIYERYVQFAVEV
jgi:hypothetical protein